VTLEKGKPIKFAVLADVIAKAMFPDRDKEFDYLAARELLDDNLREVVQDGTLMIWKFTRPGHYSMVHGDALNTASLIPDTNLELFLNERGIGLRLVTPVNDGPVYWSLRNAALAIQKQEWFDEDTYESLLFQMGEAAASGVGKKQQEIGDDLVIRNPGTGLIPKSAVVSTASTVTPADVNDWLKRQGTPHRWNMHRPHIQRL
jgi:hypothetical protein